ncbi:pyruvate kinase [Pseudomonas sp.]|uniref:pyruvate kinase n=1 Tax=Pseudomonas sp. TaxID=306 RepID=UPI00272AD23C|nr:pyruvate kinase [Pseudomonas sp.]
MANRDHAQTAAAIPRQLLTQLKMLRDEMACTATLAPIEHLPVDASYRQSAENLLHYLCLRRHEVRETQLHLADLGLSSLGRCEAATLAAVTAVIGILSRLADPPATPPAMPSLRLSDGERLLQEHTAALFGAVPSERAVRIMVTLPPEAAHDAELVEALVRAGMDCARINCAHDTPADWLAMTEHVRAAQQRVGRSCRILCDLAGPKLRTGPVPSAPGVLKIKPARNPYGVVLRPARVRLSFGQTIDSVSSSEPQLPLTAERVPDLRPGDTLRFRDARNSKREMLLLSGEDQTWCGELARTAYFVTGLPLEHFREGKSIGLLRVAELPPREERLTLRVGDLLAIAAEEALTGVPVGDQPEGAPARIGCTLPQVLASVAEGDPVWFDDGRIGGRVESSTAQGLLVRITQITHASGSARLGGDKGINFPNSPLPVHAPTEEDLEHLAFAAQHADIVGLSFVNRASDVLELLEHLERLNATHLGVVLKIETRSGFENLPDMLLTGMRLPRFGVMIARGDLAVEVGFERLAEIQEEILCLCEAAHVPVIWATQVLESLAKQGAPSRSEITDAAMSVRAECVMLNKGPYILKALTTLDDVLRRMLGHRAKKRDLLRRLKVAGRSGGN